jgi:hypothetical protein
MKENYHSFRVKTYKLEVEVPEIISFGGGTQHKKIAHKCTIDWQNAA